MARLPRLALPGYPIKSRNAAPKISKLSP